MWPRHAEPALGMWLMLSPFIFRHAADDVWLWCNDLVSGFAVISCALLSYLAAASKVHLLNVAIGLWLAAGAFMVPGDGVTPALQNELIIGVTLMMFAIIPSPSTRPPRAWLDHESSRSADPDQARA